MNKKRRFLTYATLACMISAAPCFGGRQCRQLRMDGSGPYQDGRGPRCNRQCNQNTPRMDGSGPYKDGQGKGKLIRGTCLRDN